MQDPATPSLLLDISRLRSNAERMSEVALRNNVRLRPHIKTHKCIEVARIQTAGHDGAIAGSAAALLREGVDPGSDSVAIATVARLGAGLDPVDHPPKPLYLRGPDAKPQAGFAIRRA